MSGAMKLYRVYRDVKAIDVNMSEKQRALEVYSREGSAAAQHLVRSSASLDAMRVVEGVPDGGRP